MTKVILQGHVYVPDNDLNSVLEALPTHIALTRQEVGCLVFNVTQDNQDSKQFNVYEEFTDAKAFALHQQRVANFAWIRIQAMSLGTALLLG